MACHFQLFAAVLMLKDKDYYVSVGALEYATSVTRMVSRSVGTSLATCSWPARVGSSYSRSLIPPATPPRGISWPWASGLCQWTEFFNFRSHYDQSKGEDLLLIKGSGSVTTQLGFWCSFMFADSITISVWLFEISCAWCSQTTSCLNWHEFRCVQVFWHQFFWLESCLSPRGSDPPHPSFLGRWIEIGHGSAVWVANSAQKIPPLAVFSVWCRHVYNQVQGRALLCENEATFITAFNCLISTDGLWRRVNHNASANISSSESSIAWLRRIQITLWLRFEICDSIWVQISQRYRKFQQTRHICFWYEPNKELRPATFNK